jgi:uncharacterized membrane protein (DUF4010 family)
VLAKRAATEKRPHVISGATLMASGVMYLRISAFLALFNRVLMVALVPAFAALAAGALGTGWFWSRRPDTDARKLKATEFVPQNPLELRAALLFAVLFLTMLIATHAAAAYLGKLGVYSLAAVMGVADVDPFILGITQTAGTMSSFAVASGAIVIAASSNNLVKGIYAYVWSDHETGIYSLSLLAGYALFGLLPLLWLFR